MYVGCTYVCCSVSLLNTFSDRFNPITVVGSFAPGRVSVSFFQTLTAKFMRHPFCSKDFYLNVNITSPELFLLY